MGVLKAQEIPSFEEFAKAWKSHKGIVFEIAPNVKDDEIVE